jgi:hypothetical protein
LGLYINNRTPGKEAKLPAGMTDFCPAKVAQDIERAAQGINKAWIALVPNV